MRRCPLCGLCPRRDDPGRTVQYGGVGGATVTAAACSPCAAEVAGEPPPAGRWYEPGHTYPFELFICGVCRHSAREDSVALRPVRLAAEDEFCGTGVWPPGGAGLYAACEECVAAWRPVVEQRLLRTGVLFPGDPFTAGHLM